MKRFAGFVFAILLVALLAAAGSIRGAQPVVQQSPTSTTPLAFEVASIKENVSGPNSSGTSASNGSLLRITNLTLKGMICFAYDIREFQVSGGPDWMDSNRYDVTAKPENQVKEHGQWLQMVQSLLAERFQLRFHRETKEAPIYALVIAKNRSKLQPTATPDSSGMDSSRTQVKAKAQSMAQLAVHLSNMVGRPVVDMTGLTGKFDFLLTWTPFDSAPGASDAASANLGGPSIFTALQEQLGLRLESQKGPVEILVIDHAEKPTLD